MPASASSVTRSLTLPNGLRVVLCSAPRLKRCAAALRVAAGSHDVPAQWPGLAHFLEHLFFLGTERFPSDQNLMAYVQRHGGQVNASTRERTTDFFFELPPAVFANGLDRLCEMLAHPRMTIPDQLREREVLHAEFIAWSRDEATRSQLKRLQGISPLHPLRWFHAGNRFSLPVPRQAFQQALRDFYRRFYQAGQMTLSLAGPQSLDELEALATRFGGNLANGCRIEQVKPPALVDQSSELQRDSDSRQVRLIFACEQLPAGHEQAAAFLCTWLNNAQAGGLVAELRDRGLIESLKAEVLYEFEGQVLLDIDIALATAIANKLTPTLDCGSSVGASLPTMTSDLTTEISALLFNWLTFFKSHYSQLLDEYRLLDERRLAVSSALSLARHFSAEPDEPGLTTQAISAVNALLAQLTPQTLLQPQSEPTQYAAFNIDWRLPEPNPFLRPTSAATKQSGSLSALTFSQNLPGNGEGAVYLRWTLTSSQPKLAQMLGKSLERLIGDAQQAGVTLTFTSYGKHWQLKLAGIAEAIAAVLEQALHLIGRPSARTLARYGLPDNEPAPIPIRQLLKTLPDHYLDSSITTETADLQRVWADARWTGFTTGLQGHGQNALKHAARLTPGAPDDAASKPMYVPTGQRWQTEPSDSSENAVLLFYPTPSFSIEDEAIWRLFAQLIQAPFYQRLRVELQLGYAVFSGFRQIAGQGGLLFGVQSPTANARDLVDHIEAFIRTLPTLIEKADLPTQIKALQDQLNPAAMDGQQAAELLWQSHQAGHFDDYPKRLQHSLAHSQRIPLVNTAHHLSQPDCARLCLSNRSSLSEGSVAPD